MGSANFFGVVSILPLLLASSAGVAAGNPDRVVVGAGWYDSLADNMATSVRIEFRSGYDVIWGIGPFVGFMGTTEASVYGYAGFYRDFDVGHGVVATVNGAVGLFDEGKGKDLGGVVEFRLGGELAYQFASRVRLGVTFYHISNANTANHNPGVEVLGGFLAIPLNGK